MQKDESGNISGARCTPAGCTSDTWEKVTQLYAVVPQVCSREITLIYIVYIDSGVPLWTMCDTRMSIDVFGVAQAYCIFGGDCQLYDMVVILTIFQLSVFHPI